MTPTSTTALNEAKERSRILRKCDAVGIRTKQAEDRIDSKHCVEFLQALVQP